LCSVQSSGDSGAAKLRPEQGPPVFQIIPGGTALAAFRAMLKWALIFFVISLVAGYFGFTGVASSTRTIAKVLFFIALLIFLVVLIFGVMLGMLVF
jgi:uncharacterized membrane protein YtjA (UPF0391 family)